MKCISEILDDPENVYKRYKIDITDVGYYTWRRSKEHLNEQPFGIRISRSIQWDHLFNTCYMLKTATHFSKFFYTSLRYRCACSINIYVLRFFFKDKLVVTILLFFLLLLIQGNTRKNDYRSWLVYQMCQIGKIQYTREKKCLSEVWSRINF